jgi:SAM-dependent methyltransferase
LFYQDPRFVVHIDDRAIDLVKGILEDNIEDNAVVLDLMSSWRTHWPEGKLKTHIVGLGLNAEEMADNPDLDDVVVQNLNQSPTLPFNDATFDAVIITVSVQYLINPFEVFKEVNRVLKSKGRFIVTFSNRMFPTKAVNIWKETDEMSRMQLVEFYMEQSGGFNQIHTELMNPHRNYMDDPLYLVMGHKL